uniref:Uncharacterized protein n=1 Tax=Dromaius novaehollandiae TaxID=8790 RepID=A0A8C4KLA9_DRONO
DDVDTAFFSLRVISDFFFFCYLTHFIIFFSFPFMEWSVLKKVVWSLRHSHPYRRPV